MTLVELQDLLGNALLEINEPSETEEEHKKKMQKGLVIASISSVMVRNAYISLRRDEDLGSGMLLKDAQIRCF